jgi:hypothetical protein
MASGGQAPAVPETPCTLCFLALPEKQPFAQGEPVILVLSIYNWSEKPTEPIFVSRLKSDEFVELKVIGPDGKEVRQFPASVAGEIWGCQPVATPLPSIGVWKTAGYHNCI